MPVFSKCQSLNQAKTATVLKMKITKLLNAFVRDSSLLLENQLSNSKKFFKYCVLCPEYH